MVYIPRLPSYVYEPGLKRIPTSLLREGRSEYMVDRGQTLAELNVEQEYGEETPTEAAVEWFDVAAEMSRLYEDMDQIRSDRRVRQVELAEKAKQDRLARERERRESQAAAAADVYVEDDPFVSGPIVTPARDRDPVQIPSAFEGMGSGDDDPLDFSTDPVESRYAPTPPSRRRQISLASRPEPRGIQFVDEYAGGGMTRGDNL